MKMIETQPNTLALVQTEGCNKPYITRTSRTCYSKCKQTFGSSLLTTTQAELQSPRRSSLSSLHRRRKWHVRFQLDENDCVKEDVFKLPHTRTLSKEENRTCWWDVKELKKERSESIKLGKKFVQEDNEYKEAIHMLFASCCCGDRSLQILDPVKKKHVLQLILSSYTRGIEHQLFIMLQHRRSYAVRSLLEIQSKTKNLHFDQQALIIAMQYKRTSEYAIKWANTIAVGEAILLQQQQQQQQQQQ